MMERDKQQNSGQLLVSRRAFLYGTAAAGAATVVGLGLSGCGVLGGHDDEITTLQVPEGSTVTLNDLEVLDSPDSKIHQIGEYELPYGTLIWANDDNMAACLLPTDTGSPLSQIGLLFFGSASLNTVLAKAVGTAENFEIYDVRATSAGLVWTEANVLQGTWRIYTAALSNGTMNTAPTLVDEGDAAYETPTLAATSNRAFWQVIPKQPNDAGLPSRLMMASFGQDDAKCVYENVRRIGTPPYACSDSVTIAPRLDESTTYYQLTNIDAKSGEIIDTLTLPGGMKPMEAGYGQNGFMFSFAAIYDYKNGISNLGTYTPMQKPSNGNYSDAKWFGFARTPTAAPTWCNNLLIVKSSYSVCGVDLNARQYFAIEVDNGADDYGEYLASTGVHGTFLTYTNINHQPIGKSAIHACRVKLWTTV